MKANGELSLQTNEMIYIRVDYSNYLFELLFYTIIKGFIEITMIFY